MLARALIKNIIVNIIIAIIIVIIIVITTIIIIIIIINIAAAGAVDRKWYIYSNVCGRGFGSNGALRT